MCYMTGQPETLEETQITLQNWCASARQQPRTAYNFAVVLSATGQILGRSGLYLNADPRIAHLGYHLDANHWGHGYSTEAAHTLLHLGFVHLGLNRIYAECHPENVASSRVMVKLGLRYEGCLRQSHWANDTWWDRVVYALLADEWTPPTDVACRIDMADNI
jgi:RimJ/RimL family protein N-acetyltransferase